MAKQLSNKPTESELEILQVLWQRGNATVREVHEELAAVKDAGYTTTLKLLQIMHDKGLVTRDDSSKTHIYQPNVSKEKTQQQIVGKMMVPNKRTTLIPLQYGNNNQVFQTPVAGNSNAGAGFSGM